MAKAEPPQNAAPKKKSKKPLLIAVVLALLGGGGGFYATYSGMILGAGDSRDMAGNGTAAHGEAGSESRGAEGEGAMAANLPDVAFVPVTPVVISLGGNSASRHLRMTAQLEVGPSHAAEVEHLLPRILDVLNGYLRAIEVQELEDPAALVRIRAQLLRRIQIVTGDGQVSDLLITEFVLN